MKRGMAVLIVLCMMLSLLPLSAAAVEPGGADLNGAAYRSAVNPYFGAYSGSGRTGAGGACTWYAWGRAYEKLGVSLPFVGDAQNWTSLAAAAGLQTGTVARANAIMVEHSEPNGHVLFVEKVEAGFAYVSEAGYLDAYHEDCISLDTMCRSGASTAMQHVDYIYLDGYGAASDVSFTPWSDDRLTFVDETNASIGQLVSGQTGKLTEVGFILYDINSNELGAARSTTTSDSRYFFNIHEDLGLHLDPGTDYLYKFYAIVGGKAFYSDMQSFTTAGAYTRFSPWWSDSYTYIGEDDAAIGQDVQVGGGEWTEVGMILYDEAGEILGQARDVPDPRITKYYYRIGQELGVTLEPGVSYGYRFFAVVDGRTFLSDLQTFSTRQPKAEFEPWENSRYTFISDDDACIGQRILIADGICTEIGMVLYNEQGARLGFASELPGTDNPCYYYRIGKDMGLRLEPETVYRYRFYAVINGVSFWSEPGSFVTARSSTAGVSFGIDVSEHQGVIDWDTAAKYIDFAILRCGYGTDDPYHDDAMWAYNVSQCERLGIPYGVYLYSYADTEAEALSEADHILRLLKGHTPTLPVYYDLEDVPTTGTLSNAQILRNTQLVASRIIDAGYRFGTYACLNWWQNRMYFPEYNDYEMWLAAYGDAFESASEGYGIWQYSCTGTVPGINGNVDMNYCWMDIDSPKPQHPFIDVTTSDWFRDDVAYVYQNGLMKGTGTGCFSPNEATSRGMIVTILYRLAGSPEVAGPCPFADVRKGSYCAKPITWAAQNGIVKGYSEKEFGPNDDITREQMATILYRFAGLAGCDVAPEADLSAFRDEGDISRFAKKSFRWANAMGFITGVNSTTLAPAGSAKRSQVAAILHRFCVAYS